MLVARCCPESTATTTLGNRLTPSATRALHHSLSRRDECACFEDEMPGMTPPGGRHSTNGLAAGSPRIFCRPGSSGPGTRALPGTTQAEAYAGDKRLRAKCRTAGAGLYTTRWVLTPARTGEDNRAGQGLYQGPIPLDKCYVQCDYDGPVQESV